MNIIVLCIDDCSKKLKKKQQTIDNIVMVIKRAAYPFNRATHTVDDDI